MREDFPVSGENVRKADKRGAGPAGTGEDHRGLVRDQNLALGVGQGVVGRAVDGFVFADVHIVCILGNVQIGAIGDVGKVAILGGGGNDDLAILLGFRNGLLGPFARIGASY